MYSKVLLLGSSFVRWTLVPVLFLCIIVFGGMACSSFSEHDFISALILAMLALGCVLTCIAMLVPNCTWALRIVTGLIFLTYLGYLIHDLGFGSTRNAPALKDSLLGFAFIGLPCLWFTIFGKINPRSAPPVHCVKLIIPLSDHVNETVEEIKKLFLFEDKIIETVENAGTGEFDGNEVGQGEWVMYLYGPDADALYSSIETLIKESKYSTGTKVCKRYGDVADNNARVVEFIL